MDLPPAKDIETPRKQILEELETPRKGPRPAFLVPVGCRNVAANKPVTSSDAVPIIGELKCVTDGEKETCDGTYVELGPGTQWVQIDLGEECKVYAIVVWHYNRSARAYKDVVVRISSDADFIQSITVFNADHDNSSGLGIGTDKAYIESFEGKIIDGEGARGRYVRLYSNGNASDDQSHYTEVEVYALPAK